MVGIEHRMALPTATSLSVSIIGLDDAAGVSPTIVKSGSGERVRAILSFLAGTGVRGVQLDVSMAGIRPRELDRSGRRDLAALIRRLNMTCTGLDLFIPPTHFVQPQHVDRAVSSVLGAIELAGELAGLGHRVEAASEIHGAMYSGAARSGAAGLSSTVSVRLDPTTPADVRQTLIDKAASAGVGLADFAWPVKTDLLRPYLGAGLDPATILIAGQDPAALVMALGANLFGCRLTDVGRGLGTSRVTPGSGRLDVLSLTVALAMTGFAGPLVLDLEGLPDPQRVLRQTPALLNLELP